jgi:hypothetical protein
VPRMSHAGYLLPGDSVVIDRAGWQCVAADPDEDRNRCRWVATHIHRRRDGDRVRVTALCQRHYELSGVEAVARRPVTITHSTRGLPSVTTLADTGRCCGSRSLDPETLDP